MSSFEPCEYTSEMDSSKKVASGFVVACCNAPEVFDGVKESLDEIALCIKRKVAVSFDLAI